MFCEQCGAEIPRGTQFCGSCGCKILYGHSPSLGDVLASASDRLLNVVGVEDVKKFSTKELLVDVFKRHTLEDREEHFLVGTTKTTPPISKVECAWPKPWMFFRCFSSSLILYFLFSFSLDWFQNPILIPGLIFLGTVAVPISVSIFFFELNVWKNISLFEIGKFIIAGGVVSVFIASLFFELYESDLSWLSKASAGILEEPAKLAALVYLLRHRDYQYKINGLVLGATIGTGFAVFESMGYSLNELIVARNLHDGIESLRTTTIFRGVLSPFCHVVWTAIAGAALWRVCDGKPKLSGLFKLRFLRLFAVSVICHMLWNYFSEQGLWFFLFIPIEAYVVWKIVLSLANEGIKEVSIRQKEMQQPSD